MISMSDLVPRDLQRAAWDDGVYRRRTLDGTHGHEAVAQLCRSLEIQSLTDVGAGRARLGEALNKIHGLHIDYRPVDAAFPEYGHATPADLVTCIEVLEHIEPDSINQMLTFLGDLVTRYGYFTIATGPHGRKLTDGRDAHLIQEPVSWWLPRLSQMFNVMYLHPTTSGFAVLVVPRTRDVPRKYLSLLHVMHAKTALWQTMRGMCRLVAAGLKIKLHRLNKK
jgi:hypothetical protein